ncbi:zinc finger protein 227 [Trichonephila clavipes]|nr:zinc finger protein 227 [Trichonephila clavipes]
MDETGKYYLRGEECETNKVSYKQSCLHIKTNQNFKGQNETSTDKDTVNTDIPNRCELKLLNGHTERSKSKRNLQTHAKERPYTCEICNKIFNWKGNLKIHVRIHKNEKPHVCEICRKALTQFGMKVNLRIHTEEKPYVCEVCNKTHSKLNNLKEHLRIYTKEKPYVCGISDKTFSLRSSLKRHLRIHTEEKPYACEICNMAFSDKSNLRRSECSGIFSNAQVTEILRVTLRPNPHDRVGTFDVKDAPRTSRPVIENVDKIKEIIEVDRHVSRRSIVHFLNGW